MKGGKIIYGLSKIIKEKQPKAFLLENVKGLMSINNGKVLQSIIKLLSNANYQVFYKILDSYNYSIP